MNVMLHLFVDEVVHKQGARVSSDRHRQFFHLLPCVGGLGRDEAVSELDSAGKSGRLGIVY